MYVHLGLCTRVYPGVTFIIETLEVMGLKREIDGKLITRGQIIDNRSISTW